MAVWRYVILNRVAAARPKALPMADGQTIGKLRLPLPPVEFEGCCLRGWFL